MLNATAQSQKAAFAKSHQSLQQMMMDNGASA